MTQQTIAEAVHRSQPAIANTIRLLKLPKMVQDLVQAGKLTPSHGVALLRYESVPQLVEVIASAAIEQRWTAPRRDFQAMEERRMHAVELFEQGVIPAEIARPGWAGVD